MKNKKLTIRLFLNTRLKGINGTYPVYFSIIYNQKSSFIRLNPPTRLLSKQIDDPHNLNYLFPSQYQSIYSLAEKLIKRRGDRFRLSHFIEIYSVEQRISKIQTKINNTHKELESLSKELSSLLEKRTANYKRLTSNNC